ncbi:hypothetical protein ACVDFE_40690 [Lentzea chajnantorensis]
MIDSTHLASAVNARVVQLARWTWRHPREVNRRVGVRSRRGATEGQLREALRYVEERLRAVLASPGRGGPGGALE